MSETRVSEAVARPVRGVGQGGAGWAVIEVVEAFHIYEFDERQSIISIIILTALVSFLQNTIENRLGKGLLRNVPPTTVPVVDDVDNGDADPDNPEG